MNTTYCKQTKQLYNAEGTVLQTNEKGIVVVIVDGVQKRYMLNMLLEYIERHGALPGNKKLKLRSVVKVFAVKKENPPKVEVKKEVAKEDQRKQNTRPCVKVAVFDTKGNQLGIYESVKLTSDATGVSKATISKCANGKAKWNNKGLVFQKVLNQKTA